MAAIELNNGRYQTQVQANNVPLQQLAQVPPQFRGNFTGRLNIGGTVDSFDLK
ncbi:MAG: hypothetical protein HC908_12820, partial [Calothrix sp. SM1_7_51]|nr:hypothetical protein [Calothrix sp. SM1_7_51]